MSEKNTHIIGTKVLGHDQSYCYLKNGEIVYYCEEERFSRQKFGWGISSHALDDLVSRFNIDPSKDKVLFNIYDDIDKFKYQSLVESNFYPELNTLKNTRDPAEVMMSVALTHSGLGFKNFEVLNNVEHHLLHAASAFYPSPFENAAILTLDGAGDGISTLIANGNGNKIDIKYKIPLPHSLGNFYNLMTIWLGLGKCGDEGKTMGASSYGDPSKYYDLFREKIIDFDEDGITALKALNCHQLDNILKNSPRLQDLKIMTQREFDLAATTQKIAEEIILRLAQFAKKLTGQKHVCLAGGVALNSVANGKLLKSKIFDDVWVQPAAGDGGLSIGGALWNYYVTLNHPRKTENGEKKWWIQEHTYWGPESQDEDIIEALNEFKLPIKKIPDVEIWTAQKIFENKVVGWFQGKIEAGPRSLGNRSILANPTNPDMQNIVNNKVKFREPWRPFAPSVLEEECGVYFDSTHPSPFMILVYNVLEEWKKKLPSITHIDGTARVQTVSKKTNPRYYKMIEEFKKLSGIGLVLNTSFNLKGEPIVLTPRQAIIDFLRTEMDVLVMHNYILEKKDIQSFETTVFTKQFHPIEDNFRFLKPGKHLIIDYTKPSINTTLESLIYLSGTRGNTFSILPIADQKTSYALWQSRYTQITQVWENLSQKSDFNISHTELQTYEGIICSFLIEPYMLGYEYHLEAIKTVITLCERFLSVNPQIKIWLLGPSGVLYDYQNFKSAVSGLKEAVESVMKIDSLQLSESDITPFVDDLKKRFPEILFTDDLNKEAI